MAKEKSGLQGTDVQQKDPLSPRFRRQIRLWLWIATAVFLLTPFLLSALHERPPQRLALVPMVNCLAVWVALLVGLRRTLSLLMSARLGYLVGEQGSETFARGQKAFASLGSVCALFVWPFLLMPLTWVALVVASDPG